MPIRAAATFDSPFGPVRVEVGEGGVLALRLNAEPSETDDRHPTLDRVRRVLEAYHADPAAPFDVPLAPRGTAFERSVWHELRAIPSGETRSYADIARALGNPRAVRAVGRANGVNPIAILIPCHRVIASDGTLCGYAGGLGLKRRLLEHEGALDPLFNA